MPEPSTADALRAGGGGLRRRVARGTIINATFLVGVNSLGFLRGFVAAAFLTKTDFGIWGLLAISLGALTWLKQVGIMDKFVQQEEADQEEAFQKAFTLELMFTSVLTLVMLAGVGGIALLTERAELIGPGAVVAVTYGAVFLQSPLWIFYRRLDFLRQRLLQAVDPVVGFVVSIVLAIAGAGYWSLVIGIGAGIVAGGIAAVIASPYRLRLRFDRGTARAYATFSWPLLISGLTSMVLPIGATVIGETAVGIAGVGVITLAVGISVFAERINQIVTETVYPAICAVRDRDDLLFESFVKSNRLGIMWGVPFGVALALFIGDIVHHGIGDRWEAAIGPVQAFGLIAAANQIGFNWHSYYRARGETKPIAVLSAAVAVAFLGVTVPLMFSDGLRGFAIGMSVVTGVSLVVRSFYLERMFHGFRMAWHTVRALAPTVPAVLAVLLLRTLETGPRTIGDALIEVAAYLLVTAAATWLFERSLLREAIGYLRSAPSAGAPA